MFPCFVAAKNPVTTGTIFFASKGSNDSVAFFFVSFKRARALLHILFATITCSADTDFACITFFVIAAATRQLLNFSPNEII